jgi:hypothetical protein
VSGRVVRISRVGPECPNCGAWEFDDWWHDRGIRSPGGPVVALSGALRCHGCGRFFSITRYHDGETHSVMTRRGATVP